MQQKLFAYFLAPCLLLWMMSAMASECLPWAAKLEEGQVEVSFAGETRWQKASLGQTFCKGDRLRIGTNSRATLLKSDQTILRMDGGTTIILNASWLEMLKGVMHILSRVPHSLEVKTPFVNANIEGTEFVLKVDSAKTDLWVFDGKVRFYNDLGSLAVIHDEAAVAEHGKAPRRVLAVNPRDAVQWALYYPFLIDYQAQRLEGPAASVFHKALRNYRENRLDQALYILEQLPQKQRDFQYYTLHAGLLLSIGRVDEARWDLDQALRLKPTDGVAHALQAIIALVNNAKEQAFSLAHQASKEAPASPIPYISLSYVEQARFKLDEALYNAEKAVALAPEDALAQARLAELWLMQGELDQALKVARQAVALDPMLARTQSVLGFAHLTQMETGEAKTAFSKAIVLDPADPLSRLGLGLAKIRQGELEQGRQKIEIAASLDPNNSLIRSYLGKAYYEEKRNPLAMEEYETAKELDPNDPTPYFYDAIRKQTTNRPVEALQDLQKAIELNDNRAVYRSKLLLDDDIAARSASQGKIYRNLGLEQRALLEGWKSINTEPTNYSAHRLLADSYSVLPRHEIARVSELLQSQLLQPLNTTPIQPQLAEANLQFLGSAGPQDPAFNEFNPLFERNRLTLQGSAIIGSNNTYGDEVTHSGLWNNFSYSAGQYHYETSGFRKNNDLKENIYNVFLQGRISTETNVQAEFRHGDIEQGDRIFRFDRNFFFTKNRREEISDSARFGFHHTISSSSDVIGSFIFRNSETITSDPEQSFRSNLDSISYNGEIQHLFHWHWLSLISGLGHYISNDNGLAILPGINIGLDLNIQHTNAYSYANVNLYKNIRATLGISTDFFKQDGVVNDYQQINPKFGLMWSITPETTLRLAAFRSLKRTVSTYQTIEPTQMAGFNQFFDDPNGTSAWRYGIGVDQKFGKHTYGGIEFSTRNMKVPFINRFTGQGDRTEWKELIGRAYLNWMPHPWLVFSAEYNYENLDHGERLPTFELVEVRTHRFPLAVYFFHPSGVSWQLKATYISQSGIFVKDPEGFVFVTGHDNFWVVDAKLDYRLPKRFGVLSFIVKNVFNENFNYHQQIDPSKPTSPLFEPERQFFGRLTLAF